MTVLLFSSKEDPVDLWVPELQKNLPDVKIRVAPEFGDKSEIEYALVWKPPFGMLASLPNLKAIFSVGAGADHILADPERPQHLPVVRMIDDYLRDMMSECAILGVLHFHRMMPAYEADRTEEIWQRRWPHYTPDCTVGVLGLGAIGRDIAAKLGVLGFPVHGWSRTPRSVAGMTCHHGADGLAAMLPHCRYLVCVLPLTDETRGIIDAALLAQLPNGAIVVNLGRGGHVVDDDLLAALATGHISGAFLDVFNEEPLPEGHPYWHHPQVAMTPHVAGEIVPRSAARTVAENLRRHQRGEEMTGVMDLTRGY
ncbi:MAG: glyoxylate/hydroxypyruvate reductase A [Alphaproteobacteria bacterium]|jgi:glyoxylate/hydroxypyruvate reductase A|nr:glyoxylate/hydroxypyruvate reductase A [Alphaproteobacteria bacterium]